MARHPGKGRNPENAQPSKLDVLPFLITGQALRGHDEENAPTRHINKISLYLLSDIWGKIGKA
jgi:hypothetical protein